MQKGFCPEQGKSLKNYAIFRFSCKSRGTISSARKHVFEKSVATAASPLHGLPVSAASFMPPRNGKPPNPRFLPQPEPDHLSDSPLGNRSGAGSGWSAGTGKYICNPITDSLSDSGRRVLSAGDDNMETTMQLERVPLPSGGALKKARTWALIHTDTLRANAGSVKYYPFFCLQIL